MTIIAYYKNNKLTEIEIDKSAETNNFIVTEGHLNLNNRLSTTDFEFLGSTVTESNSLQHAVEIFKKKFDEYEKKSFDWKGHSAGCLKFYWNNGETDVLTYVKLKYKGIEVIGFDFEEFNL